MKIQTKILLEALSNCRAAVSKDKTIEQSDTFCFKDGYVFTFNDEISIKTELSDWDIEASVNAVELFNFIQKVKSEEIEVKSNDNTLTIKAGKSKVDLVYQKQILLPIEEVEEAEKWKKIPSDFLEAIQFCMGACSKLETQPILTSVCISPDEVKGSDGMRIAQYVFSENFKIKEFLLPAENCPKVINMNPVKIAVTSSWVHFKNEKNVVLSSRILTDKYVDITPHMQSDGKKIKFPENINEVIERASVFFKRNDKMDESVSIEIDKGKFKLTSSSELGSVFSEIIKCEIKESCDFKITPYLFKGMLKETYEATLEKRKILFQKDNWKYVAMLRGVK